MDFTIEKGATVLDVKHLFTDMFKGLKLELFKKAHEEGESSSAKMRVFGTEAVSDLTAVALPLQLNINADMTVAEVETAFEEQAGLHVQVFRKMRNIWIETVQTDNYTLSKQIEISLSSTSS